MDYAEKIKSADGVGELFNVVKSIVRDYTGREKDGISVEFAEIEVYNGRFIGGLYNYNTNKIIVNKLPLKPLLEKNKVFHNFYLFHILLHEYVHAIGFSNELQARRLVYALAQDYFGGEHILTEFAGNLGKFIPNIVPNIVEEIPIRKNINNQLNSLTPKIFEFDEIFGDDFFGNFNKIFSEQIKQFRKFFENFTI